MEAEMRGVRQAESKAARGAVNEAARDLRQRMTRSERMLWAALRARRLSGLKFRRQARIAHYVVDFYCPARRLIVEVDGGIHLNQQREDRERQAFLEELGLRVLRLDAEAVEADLQHALSAIRDACIEAPLSLSEGEGPGVRE